MTTTSIKHLQGKLIVSCQAPKYSPLNRPDFIAAMAKAVIKGGAAAVRIDSPKHVEAVRKLMPDVLIIGLWKREREESDVCITPQFVDAATIAVAGADIIAIDATLRPRPGEETLGVLIQKIHNQLGKLVLADVDTLESGLVAAQLGADMIATTLYGHTKETQHLCPPGYALLTELLEKLDTPIISEGGIGSPMMALKALELGAYAVVVGTAITGIDAHVRAFHAVFPHNNQ
ncbi:MAG: N-acetylmannosamine-6-phosphate 2-epimerase [Cyanobacteria bacterium J083]|nr:MAG: N-acetylmannosamine-6-phosphate 2-epimerase [Cyanobacteria bacterium J083]